MKKLFTLILLSAISFVGISAEGGKQEKEHHFVFVTASYNNSEWYEKNLASMLEQDYDNFEIIYVDDCSPDGTGQLVQDYKERHPRGDKIKLIRNKDRKLAMANIYTAIHMCDDRSIVAIVDGDDWLAHSQVLNHLNTVYQNKDIWLTYGQFKEWPGGDKGFCVQIPQRTMLKNEYRKFPHGPSHLRTFYAGLFKKIQKEDLMYEGDFFAMTYDLAMMFPMLEMSGGKFKFISEVLLEYNCSNPINDHKVNQELQSSLASTIRERRPYEPLESLF